MIEKQQTFLKIRFLRVLWVNLGNDQNPIPNPKPS